MPATSTPRLSTLDRLVAGLLIGWIAVPVLTFITGTAAYAFNGVRQDPDITSPMEFGMIAAFVVGACASAFGLPALAVLAVLASRKSAGQITQ